MASQTKSPEKDGGPPSPTGQDSPGIFSIFDRVAKTFFRTKHKVFTMTGTTHPPIPTADPETQLKIDKLQSIVTQYEQMETIAKQLLAKYKAFSDTIKGLGDLFWEIGIKEAESIGSHVREVGEIHRNIAKHTVHVENSLTSLIDTIATFRTAVIEDAMLTFERYAEVSRDYEDALYQLQQLETSPNFSQDTTAKARVTMEEAKKVAEKVGQDLCTKIVLLNAKRIQTLGIQLEQYMKALQTYYSNSVTGFAKYEIKPKEEIPKSPQQHQQPSIELVPLPHQPESLIHEQQLVPQPQHEENRENEQ